MQHALLKTYKGYVKKKEIIKVLFDNDKNLFYRKLYTLCKENHEFKEAYNQHSQSKKMPIDVFKDFLDAYYMPYPLFD